MSSSSAHANEYKLKTASLSMERLDGEVIAIDFATGKYFSFQGPAADLIWLLQSEIPQEAWYSVIYEDFNGPENAAEFLTQVEHFLAALNEQGLLEPVEWLTGVASALPNDYDRGVWEAPHIMVEDELVDLLVIDPIHDTGEDGWPEIKQG